MGGSLYGLGRLPRAEYLALEGRLRAYLDEKLGDHYRIPRYYGSKPDFGDVDVLVSEAAIATTWDDLRADVAGATARSRRAHSSFAHRGTAPGVDVAARRNVAVAITDRSTDTVHASSQSGQA